MHLIVPQRAARFMRDRQRSIHVQAPASQSK